MFSPFGGQYFIYPYQINKYKIYIDEEAWRIDWSRQSMVVVDNVGRWSHPGVTQIGDTTECMEEVGQVNV